MDMSDFRIQIQLKDTSSRDAEGNVTFHADISGWSDLTVLNPAECEHETTACDDCATDWAADYYVRISPDGQTWYGLNDVPGLPNFA